MAKNKIQEFYNNAPKENIMKNRTLIIEKENKKNDKKELKDEQKFNYPRSTVEMLEQTLQIA